jgi:short/branched chain acyl-CoA dehydrogenase
MSELLLDPELAELRASVRTFAHEVVAPVAGKHDEAHTFPYDVIRAMGDMGLFGLPFPESAGGMGGDLVALCIAIEELARIDSSVAITLEAAVCLGAMPIYRFGTDEQQQRWLPDLLSGRAIGAFGLTEPHAGSDASNTKTTAKRDGDDWVLNGSKVFITNSGTGITALLTVTARTDKGVSTFLVPSGTPGLEIGPAYSKVGWNASDTHPVYLSGCRVPVENLLGEDGRGYAQFIQTLDDGRIAIAALATGMAQGCIDESLKYAEQREAFGKPIIEHQAVAFQLADMEQRAHIARLAWFDAATRAVKGMNVKREAAIAKLYASEAAVDNARTGTQIHGGYGFMNEFPVARMWRDAKVLEIGEGTSEVQRMVIARELRNH